jgi:hypothetical protein
VFDKTGTITEGRPAVTDIVTRGETDDLLQLAASVERNSEHPLGEAIVRAAKERVSTSLRLQRRLVLPNHTTRESSSSGDPGWGTDLLSLPLVRFLQLSLQATPEFGRAAQLTHIWRTAAHPK